MFNGKAWVPGPPIQTPAKLLPLAMSYDPATRSVVVVGRSSAGTFETLTLGKKSWASFDTQGVLPVLAPIAFDLAMAFDRHFNELVLYYGSPTFPPVNQTWVLRNKGWVELRTPPNLAARKLSSLTCWDSQGDVALFGGVGARRFYNDLWTFTGSRWLRLS